MLSAASDQAGLREWRRRLLAGARGATLEIHGFGTGRNLGLYPAAVTDLVLLQGPHHVDTALPAAAARAGGGIRVVDAKGPELPFADASFDTVVATLSLCFARDLDAAVAEAARVLRIGGRLLFLEHVRSASPRLAAWQDRLAGAWRALAVGCHCNYDTLAAIAAAPLRVEWIESDTLRRFPPPVRPLVIGAAIR
jgi:SAM-dependent methyltransferase